MRCYICKHRSESICIAAFSRPETHMNHPRCPNYSTLNVDWHAAKIRPKQIDRFLHLWWACMIKHSSQTVWRNNFNECVSFSKYYIFDPPEGGSCGSLAETHTTTMDFIISLFNDYINKILDKIIIGMTLLYVNGNWESWLFQPVQAHMTHL